MASVGQVGLVGSGRSMFALTHLPTYLTYLTYLTLERRRLSQRPRRVDLRQVRTEVRGRVDVSERGDPLGGQPCGIRNRRVVNLAPFERPLTCERTIGKRRDAGNRNPNAAGALVNHCCHTAHREA